MVDRLMAVRRAADPNRSCGRPPTHRWSTARAGWMSWPASKWSPSPSPPATGSIAPSGEGATQRRPLLGVKNTGHRQPGEAHVGDRVITRNEKSHYAARRLRRDRRRHPPRGWKAHCQLPGQSMENHGRGRRGGGCCPSEVSRRRRLEMVAAGQRHCAAPRFETPSRPRFHHRPRRQMSRITRTECIFPCGHVHTDVAWRPRRREGGTRTRRYHFVATTSARTA